MQFVRADAGSEPRDDALFLTLADGQEFSVVSPKAVKSTSGAGGKVGYRFKDLWKLHAYMWVL